MPDTNKTIAAALKGLKARKSKLQNAVQELARAKAELTRVQTAITDLEHALKAVK